ncbi:MAG: LAGLIDADG family homing endonuclease [Thermoproteota archaeon]
MSSGVKAKIPVESLFLDFIRNFRDENGERKYYEQIASLPSLGGTSIVIDFQDMLSYSREMVEELVENPAILQEMNRVALSILSSLDKDYASKIQEVSVRVRGLGKKISIRDIKSSLLGRLVCFEGVVVRISEIKSILSKGVFRCKTCNRVYEEPQTGIILKAPRCEECGTSRLANFELLQDQSKFIDYQEIRVQEKPEDLPAGVMPHSISLRLTGDLTDRVRPGDRVQITGIVVAMPDRHPVKNLQYSTFTLSIEVNYIEALTQELGEVTVSPEEEKKIREMSKDPWIYQKLIRSIAPSIYGLEEVKEAILLQMVGGVRRTYPDGVTVRGDINLLLIGDPGTAKSQLLKYVQRIAPRGLYTSGRGVTAAGLTAAVVRDKTGSFTLEAGAVVLADKGIAAIDEFEKMKAEDRVAIHEAMEQQSYHPSTEILLANGRKIRIGEYVDDLFRRFESKKIQGVNCEILPLPIVEEIYSAELESGLIRKLRIDRVSRHTAPDFFVHITYSNGRSILVTPEHPVYVFREGGLTVVNAVDVKEGDLVPAPRIIAENEGAPPPLILPSMGVREKEVMLPTQLNSEVAGILGYLISEGCFYRGSGCEIIFTNNNPLVLNEMKTLMDKAFGITCITDVSSFGVPSLRYVSSRLFKWFELNFPEIMRKARQKRVPSKIFSAPAYLIKEFLRTAFLGDGSVESTAICYRTASKGLAEDYQDLLLRLGIASRIVRDRGNNSFKVYITGDSIANFKDEIIDPNDSRIHRIFMMTDRSRKVNRHHDIIPAGFAHLINESYRTLGLRNDGYFYEHINKGYGITINVANNFLNRLNKRVKEVKKGLMSVSSMRELRSLVNWSQQRLANTMLVNRSLIDYYERGGYDENARLELFEKAKEAVTLNIAKAEQNIVKLNKILKQNIRFLKIKKVRLVPNRGRYRASWVYDVTVEPTHNFISHGVLLHNTVSVAKGGIVATLNARTAILAAANPVYGRYDDSLNFSENVDLPSTLLSRFDLYFIIKDRPDKEGDARLSDHILQLHMEAYDYGDQTIPPSMLRKYLAYCKKITPKLSPEATERIKNFFLQLRSSSQEANAPIPITPRHLESLIRLSVARARLMLREEVTVEDAEVAIRLMNYSLSTAGLDVSSGKIDIDILMTGRSRSRWEKMRIILKEIENLESEIGKASLSELRRRCAEKKIEPDEFYKLIEQMREQGVIMFPDEDTVRRIKR